MTPTVVHKFLRNVGRGWSGRGVAIELGCWLGASTRPLLEGLVEAGYDRPFWAFDLWTATPNEVKKAAKEGEILTIGQDLIDIYLHNVTSVYGLVNAFKGRIPNILRKYDGGPIEVCVFDAPKTDPDFMDSIRMVLPDFIPGVTILGLLDYNSYRKHVGPERDKFLAPVKFMEENRGYFIQLKSWPVGVCSCAFFKYEKELKIE